MLRRSLAILVISLAMATSTTMAQETFGFFNRGPYRESVPRPDDLLGYPAGERQTQYLTLQSVLDQMISGEQEPSATAHEHPLMDQIPLFEELVRTFSREPERIRRIGRIIRELTADEGGEDLLPAGFIALWQTFEAAMEAAPHA